jgi:hypothetical protein
MAVQLLNARDCASHVLGSLCTGENLECPLLERRQLGN